MSAEAQGHVYRHSPYKGATLLVHLAIADSVNDQNGNEFWMGQHKLAAKARIARSAAQKALDTLVADGWIEPLDEPGKAKKAGRSSRFRFVFRDDSPVVYDSRRRSSGGDLPQVTQVTSDRSGGDLPQVTQVTSDRSRTQVVTQNDPKPEPKPRARTPRDDVWDAFSRVFGEPARGTSEAAKRGKAVRDVMAAGATAEQVEAVARAELARWDGADDRHVAGNWVRLSRQRRRAIGTIDNDRDGGPNGRFDL